MSTCLDTEGSLCLSDLWFFSEERVRKGAEKLQKFLNAKQQGRLDGFFSVKPKEKVPPLKGKAAEKGKSGTKRKVSGLLHIWVILMCFFHREKARMRVARKRRGRSEHFCLVCLFDAFHPTLYLYLPTADALLS